MSIIHFYADKGDTGESVNIHGQQTLEALRDMFPGFMVNLNPERPGTYMAEVYGSLAPVPISQCHNARRVKVVNLDGTIETYRRPIVGNAHTTTNGYINRAQFMSLLHHGWCVYDHDVLLSVEYIYPDTMSSTTAQYVIPQVFKLMDIPRAPACFGLGGRGWRLRDGVLAIRANLFGRLYKVAVDDAMMVSDVVRAATLQILGDYTMVGRERDRIILYGLATKCRMLLIRNSVYRPGQEAEVLRTFLVARMFSNEVNLYHGKQLVDTFDLRTHTLETMMQAYKQLDAVTQCPESKVLLNVPFATQFERDDH